jgi:tetratricopeptide (TPR) repeat protein
MRTALATVVVFLLAFPAAGAAALGEANGASSGHGFGRAVMAQERGGASAPEVPRRSEAELERAVRAQPDDWALHVELIEASAAANHLPERERWYQAWLGEDRAAANPKRQAVLHAALGTAHWRNGDLRNARLEYKQAVRLDSSNTAYTEALDTLDAQLGWRPRDTLLLLLFFLIIVAYVALRRRRWAKALRG